ncbi:MAG: MFS transporter, partial [Bacteroidota bacterium]
MPAIAIVIGAPFGAISYLHHNLTIAMVAYFFANLVFAFYIAPMITVAHRIVPINMRAMSSAVLFLVINLIGLGLGPVFAGYLSDLFTPTYGKEA